MLRSRPWRQLPGDLLRFASTDLHELYVAVMCVFDEEAVLRPALTIDQVRADLVQVGWDEPVADVQLHQCLAKLVEWGLLDVTQDHAGRYATPEEFERRNLQWALTPAGEAAIGGVLHAVYALGRTASLQTAVIDAIADGLSDLCELASGPVSESGRMTTRLAEVEGHLIFLVANVRQFNTQLQRLLRDDATSDHVFEEVKQRTVTYLQEYISGVDRPARRVAHGLERASEIGVSVICDLALTGANLAPVAGEDPSVSWLAERHKRWDALRTWFAPTDASEPRIRSLVGVARQAILQLLRVLERRWETRRRSASVAEDFRALAGWFAQATGDEEAHRLFLSAFGLWPSRHPHMSPEDGEGVPSTTSWTAAPRVLVAPSLRTTGTLTHRGRVHPVGDPRQLRARRQREQAEILAREEAVRDSLRTDGAVRLSSFGVLDRARFTELLSLLAEALQSSTAMDGSREAISPDGRVQVILRDPGDGRRAKLRTEVGVLDTPDLEVRITVVGVAGEPATDQEAAGV